VEVAIAFPLRTESIQGLRSTPDPDYFFTQASQGTGGRGLADLCRLNKLLCGSCSCPEREMDSLLSSTHE